MANTIIEECTCCGDVIKLMDFKCESYRNFSLYRTFELDIEGKQHRFRFFLLLDNDKYPIIITEDAAKNIMKNPEYGKKLVFNHWLNRYRQSNCIEKKSENNTACVGRVIFI